MIMARKRTQPAPADAPAFDLASVANPETVAVPARAMSASARFADNPLVQVLRDSFNELDPALKGRQLSVAGYHVTDVTSAIRDAADKLSDDGIGASIVYDWGPNTQTAVLKDVPKDATPVQVIFSGKPRKDYLSETEKAHATQLAEQKVIPNAGSVAYRAWQAGSANGQQVTEYADADA
jgi:hypothetical protein